MLAFPGCSAKFFNRDCIILFNPHNNPLELDTHPKLQFGKSRPLVEQFVQDHVLAVISSLKRQMAGYKSGQSFPTCTLQTDPEIPLLLLGITISPGSFSTCVHCFLCWFFLVCQCPFTLFFCTAPRANGICGFRLHSNASPSPALMQSSPGAPGDTYTCPPDMCWMYLDVHKDFSQALSSQATSLFLHESLSWGMAPLSTYCSCQHLLIVRLCSFSIPLP